MVMDPSEIPQQSEEPTIPLIKKTVNTLEESYHPHPTQEAIQETKKASPALMETVQYWTTASFWALIGAAILFGCQKLYTYEHPEYKSVANTFEAIGRQEDANAIRRVGESGNFSLAFALTRTAQGGVK